MMSRYSDTGDVFFLNAPFFVWCRMRNDTGVPEAGRQVSFFFLIGKRERLWRGMFGFPDGRTFGIGEIKRIIFLPFFPIGCFSHKNETVS